MKNGNWVPISKTLVSKLPRTKQFSIVEAVFSLAVNYDNGTPISVSGLAKRWGWSRNRTRKLLGELNLTIKYTGSKFNPTGKKGQVAIQVRDRLGTGSDTGSGQVKFIDSRCLCKNKDRLGTGSDTGSGQVRDRFRATINDPNPNPNPTPPPPPPEKPKEKKEPKELDEKIIRLKKIEEQITKMAQRYNIKLIKAVFSALAATRKRGEIAENVLLTQLKKWQKKPVQEVEAGIKIYLEKRYWEEGKNENYLWGIIRNEQKRGIGTKGTNFAMDEFYEMVDKGVV